ncbi:MAG: hypothetical protein QXT73_08430 [Candidatus Methanomethylicaceae archaeon]
MYSRLFVSILRKAAKACYLYSPVSELFKQAIFRLPCAIGEPDLPYDADITERWVMFAERQIPLPFEWGEGFESQAFIEFVSEVMAATLEVYFSSVKLTKKQKTNLVRSFCGDVVLYYRMYNSREQLVKRVSERVLSLE